MPVRYFRDLVLRLAWVAASLAAVSGASAANVAGEQSYLLKAGDLLVVNVWRDDDLSREVLIAPDGKLSFPLAGHLQASGKSIEALTIELEERLGEFIDDPVITIALKEVRGNRFYVLGNVNRPGMFLLEGDTDVMQALSMAGGTTAYADLNSIRIIRREDGQQSAFRFEYNHVSRGRKLDQNLLLAGGDVVVVN